MRSSNVMNHGNWQVPAASYADANPKRATTLYGSDRDVFIFLVDPDNPIEHGEDTLFRGFYTWNSEVGAATFGLATFLYRFVCDNRIIWGAQDFKELRIQAHPRARPIDSRPRACERSSSTARPRPSTRSRTIAAAKDARASASSYKAGRRLGRLAHEPRDSPGRRPAMRSRPLVRSRARRGTSGTSSRA